MPIEQDDGERISFSELKMWNECPYKHKLTYKDKLSPFKGNEYTAFGTAIHLMCERKIVDNASAGLEIFEEAFRSELQKLSAAGVTLNSQLISDMKTQAPVLCTEVLPAVRNYFEEYEVVSVEEKLLEEIDEFDANGKRFKGFIDLVIKTPDDKYHIIDWKTCSWGWSFDRRTDPMTTYQLTYYKNFFCKKHDINPKNVETYFALLKRSAKNNNVEIFRVTSGAKKTENSLNLLEKAVININRENHMKNRLSC